MTSASACPHADAVVAVAAPLHTLTWSRHPPQVTRDAIAAVEQDGIVFIDEIDKIVSSAETRLGAHCL